MTPKMSLRALCLLLAVLLYVPVWGQVKDQDAFTPIPANLQASLAERLKLLVEYQRTQQWEKQYDLLSITFTQGDSKEVYVARSRRHYTEVAPDDLILDFVPKATTVHEASTEAGWWTIYGCATLRKKEQTVELYASVEAHREDGKWYFSSVGVVTPIDGNRKPCPYSNTTARSSSCCSVTSGKRSSEGQQR